LAAWRDEKYGSDKNNVAQRRKGRQGRKQASAQGAFVIVDIYDVMKHGKPFDRERFVGNLKKLPELPFDDDEK